MTYTPVLTSNNFLINMRFHVNFLSSTNQLFLIKFQMTHFYHAKNSHIFLLSYFLIYETCLVLIQCILYRYYNIIFNKITTNIFLKI